MFNRDRLHRLPMNRWLLGLVAAVLVTGCTLNAAPDSQQISVGGAPVVQLAAPRDGTTFLEGVVVNIQALVANAGANIERVEVTVNDVPITTLPDPNPSGAAAFSITQGWTPTEPGTYRISVMAFREDGTSSTPTNTQITVVSAGAEPTDDEADAQAETETVSTGDADTDTPDAADETAEDSTDEADVAADDDDSDDSDDADNEDSDTAAASDDDDDGDDGDDGQPMATFNVGANVRRGPGTNFDPPLGGIRQGETVEILARNFAGDWYKIPYFNAEGWVAASLVTVSGDISRVPQEAGPPTPQPLPPTNTPPPAPPPEPEQPAAPTSNANLVAGLLRVSEDPIVCNNGFSINIDIANLGSEDTSATGRFTVRDIHIDSGTVTTQTEGPIPIIEDGETIQSADIPLTVGTFYGERHRIVVELNPDGEIPESTRDDNRREFEYTLERGDC